MKAFIFLLLFSINSFGNTNYWVVNRDHSSISFEIVYLKLAKVEGKFNRFQGRIILEKESSEPQELGIEIFAKSIDTGIAMRDDHLRSSSFLDSQKHPLISYESKSITKSGKGYIARGKLQFRGKVIEKDISFQLSKEVEDTWKKKNRFVEFNLKLERSSLGLSWNKTLKGDKLLLGESIDVKGTLQLQPKGNLTNASKHKIADNRYLRNKERVLRGEKVKKLKAKPSQVKVAPVSEISRKKSKKKDVRVVSPPELFDYLSFLIVFSFGLFGSCVLVYWLYRWLEPKRIAKSDYLDDSLKHFIYLIIVGGYVFFSTFLFP